MMNRAFAVAAAVAGLLAAGHYHLMQPMASATFTFDGVTPQQRVADAHLRRCGPVVLGVGLVVALAGGTWITRTGRRQLLWVAVGILAGAGAFAAAEPRVPLTGPFAGPDFSGRTVSARDLGYAVTAGGVFGGLVGAAAAVLAAVLNRGVPMTRNVLLVLAAAAAAAGTAADWPQWGRDAGRNAVSPETGAPTDFRLPVIENGKVVNPGRGIAWQADLGTCAAVPPVVAGGLVWACTNARPPAGDVPSKEWDGGVLMCFRESDGKPLWKHRTPRLTTNRVQDFYGAALGSVPLVEGDRLWYVNNRCEAVCLDISPLRAGTGGDPRTVWTLDMPGKLGVYPHIPVMQFGFSASVAGDGDRLFVVTHNGVDESHLNIPAPNAPSLVCLEKATGRVLWTDNSPGKNILQCQTSSPVVFTAGGRRQVAVGQGDGWLRSFDPATGALLWKCDLNAKDSTFELSGLGERNYVVATPVFYDGRVYVPTGLNPEYSTGVGALYCVDPTKTGDVGRELPDGPGKGKPNPNSAVVWYTPREVPPDAPRIEYGKKKRDLLRDTRDFYFGRCVAGVTAHDGLVYAAEMSGFLFCFDAKTGRCQWADDLRANVWGQPLWVDGKVYVTTTADEVLVYAHGREKKPVTKVEVGESARPGLVFANGTLYVTTDSTLYAIRPPK
jgi:outer membrane protein assembly factor BamB